MPMPGKKNGAASAGAGTGTAGAGANSGARAEAQGAAAPNAAADPEIVEEYEGGAAAGAAAPDADADEAVIAEAEAVVAEAAEAAEAAADEAASAGDALAEAKEAAAEWQGKYLRLHAEWDTYRRRKAEEAAAEKLRATEKLVGDLIPVIDDFERTIDYAGKNGEEGLLGGVEAVCKKLLDVLGKSGVEVIDPAGEEYNALEAQAVATVPNAEVPDETVADVYQKGYKMGNKVLRPAMVTVTTGGPAREKPAEDSAEADA